MHFSNLYVSNVEMNWKKKNVEIQSAPSKKIFSHFLSPEIDLHSTALLSLDIFFAFLKINKYVLHYIELFLAKLSGIDL